MFRLHFIGLILACLAMPVSATEITNGKWICVAEKSTGFKLQENGEWEPVNFDAEDKYVISKLDEVTDHSRKLEEQRFGGPAIEDKWFLTQTDFVLTEIGESFPTMRCRITKQKEPPTPLYVHCRGLYLELWSHLDGGRYVLSHTGGYWISGPDADNAWDKNLYESTPYVEIGKCSPF